MLFRSSQVSTAEDETYHTQGSFIHVVTLIQRNVKIEPISYIPKIREIYKNLLLCSVIENSCYSFTHFAIDNPDKVKKYIEFFDKLRQQPGALENPDISKYDVDEFIRTVTSKKKFNPEDFFFKN